MYFCKLQSKNKELPNRLLLNRLILLTSVTKKNIGQQKQKYWLSHYDGGHQ